MKYTMFFLSKKAENNRPLEEDVICSWINICLRKAGCWYPLHLTETNKGLKI